MTEYVEREEAVEALNSEGITKNMRAHRKILAIPAANVTEVHYGEWVPHEQPLGVGYSIPNYKPTHYCSHCKGLGWEFYTLCPHCGARMNGGKSDA